jgi:hypothetical protein
MRFIGILAIAVVLSTSTVSASWFGFIVDVFKKSDRDDKDSENKGKPSPKPPAGYNPPSGGHSPPTPTPVHDESAGTQTQSGTDTAHDKNVYRFGLASLF